MCNAHAHTFIGLDFHRNEYAHTDESLNTHISGSATQNAIEYKNHNVTKLNQPDVFEIQTKGKSM